jgi:hypothetical protein
MKIAVGTTSKHSKCSGVLPSPLDTMNDIMHNRVATLDGTMIAKRDRWCFRSCSALCGLAEGVSPVYDPLQEVSTEDIRDMILRSNLETRMTILGWNHELRFHFLVF